MGPDPGPGHVLVRCLRSVAVRLLTLCARTRNGTGTVVRTPDGAAGAAGAGGAATATISAAEAPADRRCARTRIQSLRFHGSRGTTGTQASFMDLFQGDGEKTERLTRLRAGLGDAL